MHALVVAGTWMKNEVREWWEYNYGDYRPRRVLRVQFSGDRVARERIERPDRSGRAAARGRLRGWRPTGRAPRAGAVATDRAGSAPSTER